MDLDDLIEKIKSPRQIVGLLAIIILCVIGITSCQGGCASEEKKEKRVTNQLEILSIEIDGFPNRGIWSVYCAGTLIDSFHGYAIKANNLSIKIPSNKAIIEIHRKDQPYTTIPIPYNWISKPGSHARTGECNLGEGYSLKYRIIGWVEEKK